MKSIPITARESRKEQSREEERRGMDGRRERGGDRQGVFEEGEGWIESMTEGERER